MKLCANSYRTIVAILERSSRCAASTAATIAPSRADKSHSSSVTKNFRARLKNADGPFETLTAITCFGWSSEVMHSSIPCSYEDSVPVVAASNAVEVVGDGSFDTSTIDKEAISSVSIGRDSFEALKLDGSNVCGSSVSGISSSTMLCRGVVVGWMSIIYS